MNKTSNRDIFSFIISIIRNFPLALTIMLLCAFVLAIHISVGPYLLKIIFNRVSDPSTQDVLKNVPLPVLAYLSMSFLLFICFRLYDYFVEINMIPQMRKKIADVCFKQLLEQSNHYYNSQFSGSLISKINELVNGIPAIVQVLIDRFFANSLTVVIAIVFLWQVNFAFAVAMLVWVCICLTGSLWIFKKLSSQAKLWSEVSSTITGKMVDVLNNIISVKLFDGKLRERISLNDIYNQAINAEQKLQWYYFWIWFLYGSSFIFVQGLSFYFLLKGREQGWITIGDFVLVLTINIAISNFLWNVTKEFSTFSKLFGKISQSLSTVLKIPEVQDKPKAKVLKASLGEIIFDRVQFHYKDTKLLFENKSIIIKPGQRVGLVGYSGSGKSTFINLILRLYDITSGKILIDGQDIREVTQNSLHAAIGVIPQDPSLFHRTIRENIKYGCLAASDEEVIEAAKKADAHEFILDHPNGYDSIVGERGVQLSGGQRQRIMIARAILKNAPILLLDEATSHLDSVTESKILNSFLEIMQKKTTIIIAHRLSTLLHMERILLFDKGNLIADGTHHDLIEKCHLYKTLWDTQVGGFVPGLYIPEQVQCYGT